MSYLDSSVLGGMLPTPHGDVHITVGPAGDEQLYVSYTGEIAALLAIGAVDPHMAASTEATGRDALQRPYRRETEDDDCFKFTRLFATIKQVADLPGLGGRAPLNVDTLKPRIRRMKLIVNRD
jgi:hypothetical protein